MRLTIDVLYSDDSVIVVAKPGGIHVHRTYLSTHDRVFMLQEVRNLVGAHVYPVHRLDRAASGVLVFARSAEDAALWQESLACEETEKCYLAMVRGICPEAWCMERPLTSDGGVRRPARTTFTRLETLDRFSLVQARIHTGRRHQIRRHLAHCAHQIIGDTTYGKGRINRRLRDEFGLPRLFLHASSLSLRHPHGGARIRIDCPLATDLREFLERLGGLPAETLARL